MTRQEAEGRIKKYVRDLEHNLLFNIIEKDDAWEDCDRRDLQAKIDKVLADSITYYASA